MCLEAVPIHMLERVKLKKKIIGTLGKSIKSMFFFFRFYKF